MNESEVKVKLKMQGEYNKEITERLIRLEKLVEILLDRGDQLVNQALLEEWY